MRYVREALLGLDFARNRALHECTNDIVAFLDDDAVADRNWCRTIVRVFSENRQVSVCTGRVLALSLETEAQRLFEANGGFSRGDALGDHEGELTGLSRSRLDQHPILRDV